MKKMIATAAALCALACVDANATTFDFSYTFNNQGGILTGSLDGTLDGSFIDNVSNVHLTFDAAQNPAAPFLNLTRPKVAILREQGVNSHVEMAYAFTEALTWWKRRGSAARMPRPPARTCRSSGRESCARAAT